MQAMPPTRVPDAADLAQLGPEGITQLLQGYAHTIDALRHQLEWFKRQLFGSKSERFASLPDPQQMHLGQVLEQELTVQPHSESGEQQVPSHTRRKPRSNFADDGASTPFFDESKVPVQTIQPRNGS
jgi:hypothetical protein